MHYDTLEEATTAIFLLPDKQFLKIFHPAISKGGPLQPFLMDELRILTAEAITEEYDGSYTDRWVRITVDGKTGWVHGAYLSAERGGPIYYIPEDLIDFDMGDAP